MRFGMRDKHIISREEEGCCEVEPDRNVDDNEVLPGMDMPDPVVTCLSCQVTDYRCNVSCINLISTS
jgi:hypothetical protein